MMSSVLRVSERSRAGRAWVALAALVVPLAASCVEKEKKEDTDQTADLLVSCKKERDRLKVASDMCTKQLDESRGQPTSAAEVVVRLEGDILKVSGDLPRAGMAVEDASKLSDSVISQVRTSRQALQQCYVSAMKIDQAIQARTIEGKMVVRVNKAGAVTSSAFAPHISDGFTSCIHKVASRWHVPAYREERTVEVPVTLRPAG